MKETMKEHKLIQIKKPKGLNNRLERKRSQNNMKNKQNKEEERKKRHKKENKKPWNAPTNGKQS